VADQSGGYAVDQEELWNGPLGARWVVHQEALDRVLDPFGHAALGQLPLAPGLHALDVGCGCGATTLELAQRLAPGGTALGIDISHPMLELAARRAAEANLGSAVEFRALNAETTPLPASSFDLAFSRFGVMFFSTPVRAFSNLFRALRPDGHLAFVCWRGVDENLWIKQPVALAARHVPPPPRPGPEEPGPFSFADPERVRHIIEAAGFHSIAIAPFDAAVRIAVPGGLDGAIAFVMETGPVALMLAEVDADTRRAVTETLREGLAPLYAEAEGALVSEGAAWIVTARS
jgi:SAM-dependent methyltransferase